VDHHFAVLAQALANRIHAMLHERPVIETDKGARPVEAGDILILVRRRSPLFRQIIAALKAKGLPIAGVDRSDLTAPLAVQDLLSLCGFSPRPRTACRWPRSCGLPICGWSEDDLFRLAHGRSGHLWQALRDRAEERADWAATQAMLKRPARPVGFQASLRPAGTRADPARYPPPPDRASGQRGGGRHRRDAVAGAGL
jgi:ATP-dependent helicase/nuclease subunit A